MIPQNTCPSWMGEWRTIGKKGNDGGNVNDGVGNGIGGGVWSVERNGVIWRLRRSGYDVERSDVTFLPCRNGYGVWRNGGVCPRQIDAGKNDWVDPPRGIGNDVGDVSSHYFWVSPLPGHPPCAASDDFFLFHNPNLDPSHEKTRPSTVCPSRPLPLPQPSASAPTSQFPPSLPGLLGKLGLGL